MYSLIKTKKLVNIFLKVILTAAITFILIETSVRIYPFFLKEPDKSRVISWQRNTLPAQKHYYGKNNTWATNILLPPPHKKDIMFIGDSFPAGARTRAGMEFPAVVQKLTDKKVVNLAIGGIGPVEYNRMVEVGMRYDPDHIIYCMFANDFRYFKENITIEKLSRKNTDLRFETDRNFFYDEINIRQRMGNMMGRTENLFVSLRMLKLYRMVKKLPPIMIDKTEPCFRIYKGVYYHFQSKNSWDEFISWNNENVKKGFNESVLLVYEAHHFAVNQGKHFLVVLIPSREMVYSGLISKSENFYDDSHGKTYTEFVKKMKELNVPIFDATEFFVREAAAGTRLFLPLDGHFTETGHQKMAEAISEII